MTNEAVTYQRVTQRRRAWHKAFTKPSYLRRFRYFIETSDWDDVILAQDEWISRICVGVIIVATLYFIPPVLTILFFR